MAEKTAGSNVEDETIEDTAALTHIAGRHAITVDCDKYDHLLDTLDLTDEERQQFLQTMWNIVVGFIDMGFGVHPVQQAQENTCGKLPEIDSESHFQGNDVVKSDHINLTHNFTKTAK